MGKHKCNKCKKKKSILILDISLNIMKNVNRKGFCLVKISVEIVIKCIKNNGIRYRTHICECKIQSTKLTEQIKDKKPVRCRKCFTVFDN